MIARALLAGAGILLAAVTLAAEGSAPIAGPVEDHRPQPLRDIGYEQKLGEHLPLDLPLRDESGQAVTLGRYFHGRPVILSVVYYECPMLCTLSQNGLVSALNTLTLNPGKDFEIVTVSFDPRDTAAQATARKKTYLKHYARAGAEEGWHFLTGDRESLARLTSAVGFKYSWDDETKQFAHGTGVVVLTPDGVVSRYLYGIEYAPKDLRLALVESSAGKVGSPVDSFLLACYKYDPKHGRYGAAIMNLVRAGGVATIAAFLGFVGIMRRRDRAAQQPEGKA